MATALSMDLRWRVLAAIAAGASCRRAAQRFGISAASAIRWNALQRLKGNVRQELDRQVDLFIEQNGL